MNHEERDEQLDAGYLRASQADAGRPAAATRVAILAEAAAAAATRRRAQAANEPRYWLRAVAGVAVVGVGLLLWRQVDHRLPGEPPVVAVAPAMQEAAEPVQVTEPLPGAAPTPAAEAPRATASRRVAEVSQAADAVADAAVPAPQPRAEQRAPVEPPSVAEPQKAEASSPTEVSEQRVADALAADESAAAGARLQSAERERAAAPPPDTAQSVAQLAMLPDAAELLRQHFPLQYQSDSAHRLWLVRDAAGEVLQIGELAPGESLDDLVPQLESDLGGRRPGAWRTESVPNARGQLIELSVSRTP